MKRFISTMLAVIALCAIFTLSGCNKEEKKYICIISAMENEIELLLKNANIDRVDKVGEE